MNNFIAKTFEALEFPYDFGEDLEKYEHNEITFFEFKYKYCYD